SMAATGAEKPRPHFIRKGRQSRCATDTISGRSVPEIVSPARAALERSRNPHREAIPQGSPSDHSDFV
ncbi:hypothetical protein, partial [uncultured Methylobacterium sp.]|uniref:hypothetical protein n=1 Tax=uncultured Methylobacterium sp. TaxID=157278 RepID=UPI0026058A8A